GDADEGEGAPPAQPTLLELDDGGVRQRNAPVQPAGRGARFSQDRGDGEHEAGRLDVHDLTSDYALTQSYLLLEPSRLGGRDAGAHIETRASLCRIDDGVAIAACARKRQQQ